MCRRNIPHSFFSLLCSSAHLMPCLHVPLILDVSVCDVGKICLALDARPPALCAVDDAPERRHEDGWRAVLHDAQHFRFLAVICVKVRADIVEQKAKMRLLAFTRKADLDELGLLAVCWDIHVCEYELSNRQREREIPAGIVGAILFSDLMLFTARRPAFRGAGKVQLVPRAGVARLLRIADVGDKVFAILRKLGELTELARDVFHVELACRNAKRQLCQSRPQIFVFVQSGVLLRCQAPAWCSAAYMRGRCSRFPRREALCSRSRWTRRGKGPTPLLRCHTQRRQAFL